MVLGEEGCNLFMHGYSFNVNVTAGSGEREGRQDEVSRISRNDQQSSNGKKKKKQEDFIKGPWTPEEDRKLRCLVKQYVEEDGSIKSWTKIACGLKGRVGKQCRERWLNHLCPNIKKEAKWSKEEEQKLVEAHKVNGNKWSTIAQLIPGRTENSIKNHWNAAIRRLKTRNSPKKPKRKIKFKPLTFLERYIQRVTLLETNPSALILPESPSPSLTSVSLISSVSEDVGEREEDVDVVVGGPPHQSQCNNIVFNNQGVLEPSSSGYTHQSQCNNTDLHNQNVLEPFSSGYTHQSQCNNTDLHNQNVLEPFSSGYTHQSQCNNIGFNNQKVLEPSFGYTHQSQCNNIDSNNQKVLEPSSSGYTHRSQCNNLDFNNQKVLEPSSSSGYNNSFECDSEYFSSQPLNYFDDLDNQLWALDSWNEFNLQEEQVVCGAGDKVVINDQNVAPYKVTLNDNASCSVAQNDTNGIMAANSSYEQEVSDDMFMMLLDYRSWRD